MQQLAAHMTPQTVVVDIGSNIGLYSYAFASRGVEVFGFEPFVRNVAVQRVTGCINPELAARCQGP